MSNKLNKCYLSTLTVIPPQHSALTVTCKADSGASKTYIKPQHKYILDQRQTINNGPQVLVPNGSKLQTIETGFLPLHSILSTHARKANILEGLNNASLLSIGQLCDDDCVAIFDKRALHIIKNGILVLKGRRNWNDGLWDVDIKSSQSEQSLNYIVWKDKTKMELAEYYHKCAFSPALSTFIQAIKNGHFLSWPGIERLNFEKLIINKIPTAKGHLDQERSNLQSTKENEEDFNPSDNHAQKTRESITTVQSLKRKTYSDQTGRFPHRSSRGNEYIMVMYNHDANAILVKAIPNRQAKTIANAWEELHNRLTNNGHETKKFILDNECSMELKTALKKHNKSYERTPPHVHRRNAAERAIRTFKNHLLAGFATCDGNFPLTEWDRLLPQAELTLNLMRTSRVNKKLSAHAYLFGNFNFSNTPLAPPGTKVLIHKKAKTAVRGIIMV